MSTMERSRSERRKREARGRLAEALAALWLRAAGYSIVHRRLRTPVGEIDIVVRKGGTVAMVEVKARQTTRDGLHSLSAGQRRRIERAAAWALSHGSALPSDTIRFDLIVMRPFRLPVHLKAAWTPESRF